MKKFLTQCLLASLFITSVFAQTPTTSADQAETEKTKQENEKKAFVLLDAIIAEAASLKLPENRAYVQAMAADLLWSKDEARARALFQEAAALLAQVMNGIESDDPTYYNRMQSPTQLRQQMVQMIGRRDAQLALEILRATRPPNPPDQGRNAYNPEANLEMQLAAQAAQSDPKRAVQIAEASLENGYSQGVLDTISQLQAKDPEAARTLASKLVAKLKSEDLTKNSQATGIAASVLYLMNNQPNARAEGANKQPLFSEQDKKEFIEIIVAAKLKASSASIDGGAPQLTYPLQQMLPMIEKYAPTQAAALRRTMPAPQAPVPVQNKAYEELVQVQQKGTVEQMLAFAKNATPEISSQAYNQAAWKAFNQGETDRAREIVNAYVPSNQRRNMLENFDQMSLSQAANAGKMDEARRALARIQSPERKVALWLELANTFIGKGDKQTALQLLQEAQAMIGNRAENANQFNTQLNLIRTLAPLAPTQTVEKLEPLLVQLNALIAAAEVLDGFEQRNGFQNGEMRLQDAGGMTSRLLQQFAETLATVASSELDRSITVIDRFERPEARLLMRLTIVHRLLRTESNGRGSRARSDGGPPPPPPPPMTRRP